MRNVFSAGDRTDNHEAGARKSQKGFRACDLRIIQ
jgi:hypothetical protein